ncbi:MarR family transcriptional regulator [Pseudomonas sp. ODNR1LW]|nr:MarR family transcriptional regulator [Pseudomonas sp. ODNR1LW]
MSDDAQVDGEKELIRLPGSDLEPSDRESVQLEIKRKIAFVSRRWTSRAVRLFKAYGFTSAQRAPLDLLQRSPEGLTQSELAQGLQLSEPTLSRRVTRLLADGLVSKHRLPGDGRANLIKLAPAGQRVLSGSEATAALDRDRLFLGLSDEELNAALRVLNLLAARIDSPVEGEAEPELAAVD